MYEENKGGWGPVYQEILRNKNLDPRAKALYAYLSSIAGTKGVCYPSIDTITKEMGMSKNNISKYMNQLIALGIVEKEREKSGNIYGRNIYKLTHEVEQETIKDLNAIFRAVENRAVENRAVCVGAVEEVVTNNNNTNNNNINNNININNRAKHFTPPTLEEVQAYCEERNNGVDAERFIDFYTAKDWMIGKNKMKDWKAAVRTWENKDKKNETATSQDEYKIEEPSPEVKELMLQMVKEKHDKNPYLQPKEVDYNDLPFK